MESPSSGQRPASDISHNVGDIISPIESPSSGSEKKASFNVHIEQLTDHHEFVKWGVKWQKQPTYMLLFALGGLVLAVSHHAFYSALHGQLAGTNSKQQWAHNIGNIFAVLVVAMFHTANIRAYDQYLWSTVRGRAFSVANLDRIFSLTSDPTSFFSLEIMRKAPVTVLLALACWIMALAGVLPPGTLTVVPGIVKEKQNRSMPSLNWTSDSWLPDPLFYNFSGGADWQTPTSLVLTKTAQVAETMDLLPLDPPAINSSYMMPIRGPYIQCEPANSSELIFFNFYNNLLVEGGIYSETTQGSMPINISVNDTAPVMLFFSAFDLTMAADWQPDRSYDYVNADIYNDWVVPIPPDFLDSYGYMAHGSKPIANSSVYNFTAQMVPRQLFVQTSETSFVCTLGNGTRDVYFDFSNGDQTITYGDLQEFEPLFVPIYGLPEYTSAGPILPTNLGMFPYVAVYTSLTSMLSGNLTVDAVSVLTKALDWQIWDTSSRIINTGLETCDDFTLSSFNLHPVIVNQTYVDPDSNATTMPVGRMNATFEGGFKPAPWKCRNGTL
ncbi:uncharacterized protein LY89DRAFT_597817 [Mollisia scopiformis]|uniref:Uncharacterized protein n=1 Tax=Mollisia scopiformis TaxID=149040 RepID=A0A132BD74_MOLSC|nr:uncharacterized protein LY89DRAFT_597817 [Mollisia scopiformis]KUJ09794.1 hypothetical protein LY89DRAFT_597817 [Mollisia scopiformis]